MLEIKLKQGTEHRTRIISDIIDIQCETGYPANEMFWLLYNEEKSCLPVGNPDYDKCMTAKYQKCYDRIEHCVSRYLRDNK